VNVSLLLLFCYYYSATIVVLLYLALCHYEYFPASGVIKQGEKYIMEITTVLNNELTSLMMIWSDREGVKIEQI
jgi:hypothetical protein